MDLLFENLTDNWFVGVYSFLSDRDPKLLKTLDVYDGTGDFLRRLEIDGNTLRRAIIQALRDDSCPLRDGKSCSRYVDITSCFVNSVNWHQRLIVNMTMGTTKSMNPIIPHLNLMHTTFHKSWLMIISQVFLSLLLIFLPIPFVLFCCSFLEDYLMGVTEEERQKRHKEILSTR